MRDGQVENPAPYAAALDQPLAYQPEATTVARLAETLAALANAGGGTLLIGLDPLGGRPPGLADPEAALDRALRATLSTDPPLIIPLPQLTERDGISVVSVTVPPGLPHVYSSQGKYLIREGRQNRPMNPSQLRWLMMEREAAGFETRVPDGARLEDLDWDKAARYLASQTWLANAGAEAALLQRGCLAVIDGQLKPSYAGLLLFGREPQRWVPSSGILAARYNGPTMDDLFVKEEIRGTLPEQIRQAEAFLVGNMRRRIHLLGLQHQEETEYPLEAVREAIVNAVAHRDYQIRGDETRLLLFQDRVEFYSPGRLPGHVTVDNLIQERFSRNEIIVQVLSDMGFIERLGYGIDRMIRRMVDAGLLAPRFAETAAGFQVTLVGHGAAPGHGQTNPRLPSDLFLNERQQKALAYLAEKGRITNREFQELCPDISVETIRRDLANLTSRNLLLKIGEKRGTYYILK